MKLIKDQKNDGIVTPAAKAARLQLEPRMLRGTTCSSKVTMKAIKRD